MRGLNVAVCKPDHLGDFVLALPALRQLQRAGAALTLFIAPGNVALARHYCPQAETIALDMPHLRRDASPRAWTTAYGLLGKLRAFDAVVFLRRDAFLQPGAFAQWTDAAFFIEDRDDVHQARLEHDLVSDLVGPYDIDAMFFDGRVMRFPTDPRTVVFAIGAGFPHKKWSPLLWAQLGLMLQDRGIGVRILSGPGEIAESHIIARTLGHDCEQTLFVGGSNFDALEDWVDACDVVIAVDGGSAHLCALRKPVLSLFGPSPIARYAPIGASNRAVTRNLTCSPCVGFDQVAVNACLSRECLYGLEPRSVLEALFLPERPPGETVRLAGADGTDVRFGLSNGSSA